MRLLYAIAVWLCLCVPALAQDDPALLVADEVTVEDGTRLVATGNVEVLQGDRRLIARQITYDRGGDRLLIEGPVRIIEGNGDILLADSATLDQQLEKGILKSARIVLDEQLQIAAVEAQRIGTRYTQMSRVAATSCQVCGDRTPLWQIRATRVVHDREAQQLYFDNAQLRIKSVPVFYIPRLRLPDPTLKRARGFMIPRLRSSTLLGFGIRTPYFIPIGDHQDVTLTPYISPVTRTLELRYRRLFVNGEVEFNGALSNDTLTEDTLRGYLFATGRFAVGRGYTLTFDLKTTGDDRYLSDYGITGQDRLDSNIRLARYRPDSLAEFNLYHYQSVRSTENNATQPTLVANALYEKRFFPGWLAGGEWRLSAEGHSHYRYSNLDVDGTDADDVVDGRDVTRINAELSWRKRWTLPMGIRAGARAHLWLDHFETRQDAAIAQSISSVTPGSAVDLRWPFARRGAAGGRSLIEPIAQFGWMGGDRPGNANDESTLVEFDEANLLSLSRFPAADRREQGATLATGLRVLHEAPDDWSVAFTLGRVWRDTVVPDFTPASGLDGKTSDWLVAARFDTGKGFNISARGLADDSGVFSKAAARAGWNRPRFGIGASYQLLVADPTENRENTLSEWRLDANYKINQHWQSSTDWRFDVANDRLDQVGLGLQYQNECLEVDFSTARHYARSTSVEPTTTYDLSVALKGFSTGGSAKEYRRSCSF